MIRLAARTRDMVSSKLLLPLSRARRSIRASSRPVMQAYYQGMRFRRAAAGWDSMQKSEWILDRLRFIVRRAYRETDYYHELLDDIGFDPEPRFSFAEFAGIPALDREDVHHAGQKLLSKRLSKEQLVKDSTGGSSGAPTEVWLGPEERGWTVSAGEHFMQLMGVSPGDRTGYLWAHHLDPQGTDSLRERFQAFETNTRYFECLRLSPDVLEAHHRRFELWRPACIVAYASAIGHLAEHILEHGYRPGYPTRCIVTGAEKLLPHHRDAVERAFRRPVHERYGSRDVGYIAFQLEPYRSLRYFVDWANVLVEPETLEPESAILITKLHADGMPMLRYRIGDVGKFNSGGKRGHPVFSLEEVIGRKNDRIWMRDGRWVDGIEVPHMMKDYPVREYMFLQRTDFSIDIQIVPKDGFGEQEKKLIAATVQSNLPGLAIRIRLVEQIPRTPANKWRPVISEVKQFEGVAA